MYSHRKKSKKISRVVVVFVSDYKGNFPETMCKQRIYHCKANCAIKRVNKIKIFTFIMLLKDSLRGGNEIIIKKNSNSLISTRKHAKI